MHLRRHLWLHNVYTFWISIIRVFDVTICVCLSIHLSVCLLLRKLVLQFQSYLNKTCQTFFLLLHTVNKSEWAQSGRYIVWLTNKLSPDFCSLSRYGSQICIVLLILIALYCSAVVLTYWPYFVKASKVPNILCWLEESAELITYYF